MTVLEVIQRSAGFLAEKGVESPRLQIELILAHALKLPRLQLYLDFQRELAEPELAAVREMVRRRGQREPLQYILGTTSFCGLEIKCTSAALVPRPETEILAERAWMLAAPLPRHVRVLDIGTGTGCIAIAILKHAPNASVVAIDISADALELARENARAHDAVARVDFRLGDAFAALLPEDQFDLLVSNPPYIPSAEVEQLQPEVRDFEPRGALDGGPDGLDVFRRIASEGPGFLKPNAKAIIEFSDGQAGPLKTLLEDQNWIVEEIVTDYSARPRILIARVR